MSSLLGRAINLARLPPIREPRPPSSEFLRNDERLLLGSRAAEGHPNVLRIAALISELAHPALYVVVVIDSIRFVAS